MLSETIPNTDETNPNEREEEVCRYWSCWERKRERERWSELLQGEREREKKKQREREREREMPRNLEVVLY